MASRVLLSQARSAASKHAPLSDNLIAHLLRPLKNPPAASPAATNAASTAAKISSAADPSNALPAHSSAPRASDSDRPYRSQLGRKRETSAGASNSAAVVSLLLNLPPTPKPIFVGSILDTCAAPAADEAAAIPVVSWSNALPGTQDAAAVADSPPVVLPLPVLSADAAGSPAGPVRRRPAPAEASAAAAEQPRNAGVTAPRGVHAIVDEILSGRTKDWHKESARAAAAPPTVSEPATALPAATVAAVTAALRAPPSPKPRAPAPAPASEPVSVAADFPPLPADVILPDVFPLMPSPIASPKAASYVSALSESSAVAAASSASQQVQFTIGSPADEFFSPDASPPASPEHNFRPITSALDAGDSAPAPLSPPSFRKDVAAAATTGVYHHPHFSDTQDSKKGRAGRKSSKGKQSKEAEAKAAAACAVDRCAGKRTKAVGSAEADDWVKLKLEQQQGSVGHGRAVDGKRGGQAGVKTNTTVAIGAPGGVVRTLELYLPYSTVANNSASIGSPIGAVAPSGPRVPDGTRGFSFGRGKTLAR